MEVKGAPQRARCADLVRRKVYLYFNSLRVSFRDGHLGSHCFSCIELSASDVLSN